MVVPRAAEQNALVVEKVHLTLRMHYTAGSKKALNG